MTNRTHTHTDSELLSAYLDNQLDADERASLEQRMPVEPSLRVELDELRATVALCKQVEPVIPPRSFTLDPATVRQRQPFWQQGWLRLSGGVLAMMLGIVVITALYGSGSPQEKSAQVARDEHRTMAAHEAPANEAPPAPVLPQMPEATTKPDTASPAAVAAFPSQMHEGGEADMGAMPAANDDTNIAVDAITRTEHADQPENPEWTRPSVAAKPYTPPAVLDEEEALGARPSFVVRHSPIPEATPSPKLGAGASQTSMPDSTERDAPSAQTATSSSDTRFPFGWVLIPVLLLIGLSGAWIFLRSRKI